MKEYIEGSVNILAKAILKYVSSNETFLEQAKKEKPEKFPRLIKSLHKGITEKYKEFEFHTINEKSKNNFHIIYFHGGGLCLKGGIPQWMMIDKWIKHTDAKASYVIYPMIPHHQTKEICEISFEIYQHILSLYPNDKFILIGDSAGGLIILSILQLIESRNIKKPALNVLLSPWIDFSLSNPDMSLYEDKDKVLALPRFEGLNAYNSIDEKSEIVSPMEYEYDEPIHIYGGTNDILYPDMLLFEEKNPHIRLKIFYNCPHVFMLLPMKQSDIVHKDIIHAINLL